MKITSLGDLNWHLRHMSSIVIGQAKYVDSFYIILNVGAKKF